MADLIFVHGAWHGGWYFSEVGAQLTSRGYRIHAPDLPGSGNLDNYLTAIAEVLKGLREPAILIGHSQGGLVMTAVAERLPHLLNGLIYVSAFLPTDGQSINDILRQHKLNLPLPYLTVDRERQVTYANTDVMEEYLFHDCPPGVWALARERLRPEPIALSKDRVTVTAERAGRIPRAYIECLQDRAIPLSLQRAMVAAAPCVVVASMDCGHMPFYSQPRELAAVLDRLCGEFTSAATGASPNRTGS
jgi:pimeloyl-ACP methyl ester carboxylesterase